MIVLDASAVLAFLQGERGAEHVASTLHQGVIGAANWSEVAQKVIARGGDWPMTRALLASYGMRVEPVTPKDGDAAAALWRRGSSLSLGDRLCLALADRLDARVLTADRAWTREPRLDPARIEQLRPQEELCLNGDMSTENRIVTAERLVAAPAEAIFELIADPESQPRWDGNDNLAEAAPGQRVHAVGDVFVMTNTGGAVRENTIVEFEEGRRIAWKPAPPGEPARGHVWRWELEPQPDGRTLVRHTYDWTALTDETRLARARSFTAEALQSSVDRLAALAESR